jgi:hypothetical protein
MGLCTCSKRLADCGGRAKSIPSVVHVASRDINRAKLAAAAMSAQDQCHAEFERVHKSFLPTLDAAAVGSPERTSARSLVGDRVFVVPVIATPQEVQYARELREQLKKILGSAVPTLFAVQCGPRLTTPEPGRSSPRS